MTLIKKVDVDNHFAEKRATTLRRLGLLRQPAAAATLPAEKPAKAKRSNSSRTQRNSFPSVSATSIPIVADPIARADRTVLKSRQD